MREKFATQVDSIVLEEIRSLAKKEGRQIQALVEEALADLIEKRRNEKPRDHVMKIYRTSHAKYAELYKKLAQ